jgi:hypothetical protein
MAVTINGITCQELVNGYTESYDIQGGPGARKGYLCNWSDRFTVIHGILGLSSAPIAGGLITLRVPLAYPELAAESTNLLASMYARNVEVYGRGPPVQGASNVAFTSAEIYVTFGNFPWTFSGIDFFQLDPTRPYIWAEQHMVFSSEFITLPGSSVKFATSGKVLSGTPYGFNSPLQDMTITLKNVPYLPSASILNALQNPVNSVAYLQCNPGFLLFRGAEDERTKAPDGTQTASLTLSFSYRPIAPWDYTFDASAGIWDKVVSTVGGNNILNRSDLSLIIPSVYV